MMTVGVLCLCALAAPVTNFPRRQMTDRNGIMEEVRQLTEFIRKRDPNLEIRIIQNGDGEELKQQGWERLPWRYRDCEIWVKEKENDR